MTPAPRPAILACLALALSLTVSPAAAQAPETAPISFVPPAQWDGLLQANGTWAVLLFKDGGAAADLDADVGEATNRTYVSPGFDSYAFGTGPHYDLPPSVESVEARVRQGLAFSHPGWSYLFVQAERVQASFPQGTGDLVALQGGRPLMAAFPPGFQPSEAPYFLPPQPTSPVAAWSGHGLARGSFALRADGVSAALWSNAEPECRAGPCLDGAGTWERQAERPGVAKARLMMRSELGVDASGGSLSAGGELVGLLVGGEALDLGVAGSLRLPLADVPQACAACSQVEDQTVLVEGDVRLARLQVGPGGSMQADLGGAILRSRVDERPVDPASLLPTAGLAGAAAVATAVLWKAVAVLLSRRDPLANAARRAVLDAVVAHPGATYRELMRATGLGDGTVRHHLARLERAGLLAVHESGGRVRYFENHGRYDASWRSVAALRDPGLRDLYDWLRRHPGARLPDVRAAHPGWSEGRVRRRMARLVAWGLVETEGASRSAAYRVRFPAA